MTHNNQDFNLKTNNFLQDVLFGILLIGVYSANSSFYFYILFYPFEKISVSTVEIKTHSYI